MSKDHIILFDIDHTLFDANLYLKNCLEAVGSHLGVAEVDSFVTLGKQAYKEHRLHGTFRLAYYLQELMVASQTTGEIEELTQIFTQPSVMKESLYPDVEKVLGELSQRGVTLGIFSHGLDDAQRGKIASFIHYLSQEHIYIDEVDKLRKIPHIVEKYKNHKVWIIDDLVVVLRAFKKANSSVRTVLITRDSKKTDSSTVCETGIDYTIADLEELLTITA